MIMVRLLILVVIQWGKTVFGSIWCTYDFHHDFHHRNVKMFFL